MREPNADVWSDKAEWATDNLFLFHPTRRLLAPVQNCRGHFPAKKKKGPFPRQEEEEKKKERSCYARSLFSRGTVSGDTCTSGRPSEDITELPLLGRDRGGIDRGVMIDELEVLVATIPTVGALPCLGHKEIGKVLHSRNGAARARGVHARDGAVA